MELLFEVLEGGELISFVAFFFWKLHEEKKKNKTKNTILNSNNKIMDRKYPKFR